LKFWDSIQAKKWRWWQTKIYGGPILRSNPHGQLDRGSFRFTFLLFFAQNLRTIPASAEEQSLKFSVKVVKKTAASAAQ